MSFLGSRIMGKIVRMFFYNMIGWLKFCNYIARSHKDCWNLPGLLHLRTRLRLTQGCLNFCYQRVCVHAEPSNEHESISKTGCEYEKITFLDDATMYIHNVHFHTKHATRAHDPLKYHVCTFRKMFDLSVSNLRGYCCYGDDLLYSGCHVHAYSG